MPLSKTLNLGSLQGTVSVTLLTPPGQMANKDFIVNFIERKCAYRITAVAGAESYSQINTACVDFSCDVMKSTLQKLTRQQFPFTAAYFHTDFPSEGLDSFQEGHFCSRVLLTSFNCCSGCTSRPELPFNSSLKGIKPNEVPVRVEVRRLHFL